MNQPTMTFNKDAKHDVPEEIAKPAEKVMKKAVKKIAKKKAQEVSEVVATENTELINQSKQLSEAIDSFVLGSDLVSKLTKEQVELCKRTALSFGLNPLKREIHFVAREIKKKNERGVWEPTGKYDVSIIVGYETYLKRAEGTGRLDGWNVFLEKEGNELKAVIVVYKKGWQNPFKHEVYLSHSQPIS